MQTFVLNNGNINKAEELEESVIQPTPENSCNQPTPENSVIQPTPGNSCNQPTPENSVIQPTPGNLFIAAQYSESESISPKSSSYSTHGSSSGILSDFNFTFPSSAHLSSRKNTPLLSSTEDLSDKKKEPCATSTPFVQKQRLTRNSENVVNIIVSSLLNSDDAVKHKSEMPTKFTEHVLDVPAWSNTSENVLCESQKSLNDNSVEVNVNSNSAIQFSLKTDSQSVISDDYSNTNFKNNSEKIIEDDNSFGSPSTSMNLELSQDFSQVIPYESPVQKSSDISDAQISHRSLGHFSDDGTTSLANNDDCRNQQNQDVANNNVCKCCFPQLVKGTIKLEDGKLIKNVKDRKIDKIQRLKIGCSDQICNQCSSTLELTASKLLSTPIYQSPDVPNVKSIQQDSHIVKLENKDSNNALERCLNPGMKVFALYTDNCFYPGVIMVVKRQFSLVTVKFDDGTGELNIPIDDIITTLHFQKGQKVSVKAQDGYYYDGEIYASDIINDQHFYCVNVNGTTRIVPRSSICLKKSNLDQLQLVDVKDQDIKKVLKKGFKRKRHTEVPISSSSSYEDAEPKKRNRVSDIKLSDKARLLFKDLLFLIIDTKQQSGENGLDKDLISKLITSNNGEIISTIHSREFHKAKNVLCISDGPSSSHIFLYCVVVGIPILHHDWLINSIKLNTCQSYHEYLVPAGLNIHGDIVSQIHGKREPYNCLNPLRIYVHQDTKTNSKDFNLVLSKAGCERVAPGIFVTEQTRVLNFSLLNVDYILTLNEKVPSVIWDASVVYEIPVVTFAWLVECLITNQLVDANVSPLFLYKPI
ncbi:uncharacterized protein LOC101236862 isoform X3 [Hydra vulgaris]|uniref:Uncharacterized protein LOC101236862 isoform X3 n=1 Tax=Hydra vulgaris TaxID=6087 RepID=A0ABM4CBZ7_HYDVU